MKKSTICAHLVLACCLLCFNVCASAAIGDADPTTNANFQGFHAAKKTARSKKAAGLKAVESKATAKKSAETKKALLVEAAELSTQLQVTEHAEPQMDVAVLKKFDTGGSDLSVTTLYELGYIKGNIFEGASSEHEFTVYFPLPVDAAPSSGIIKLRYKTSALTGTVPDMRVEVNDTTVYSTPLPLEPNVNGLDIPVSPDDLKLGNIKLTVKASVMPSDVRCFDERKFALHYIHILPETRVELFNLPEASSLRGVWSELPKHVIMSVPQTLTPELMKVVLQASMQLRLSGKTVSFVKLPQLGHMVIADRDYLEKFLPSLPGAQFSDFRAGNNISVVRSGRLEIPNIIVMTEAAPERDMQLLGRDWRKVTLAGGYIDQTPAGMDIRANRTFTLGEMGVSEDPRTILRTLQWQFFAGLPEIPGNMRIKALHVNVVAPPSRDRMDERLLLYVYVNNILQEVQPVENTGKTQSITFNIANYSQWAGRNHVRIMAQRFAPRDCMNSLASYQMQITRDSTIEFEKFEVSPKIFNDLHPYFANGFDLYIEPDHFVSEHLPLLTTALSDQKYDLANLKVISYDGKTPFKPEGPFMIYGRPKISLDDMTVRFDRGPIEVQSDDKRILLAVQKLPSISIAQVVKHNGKGGMWLAPVEGQAYSDVKEYFLEQGDTSFADSSGEVMNIKTRQMNRAKITYPEFLDILTRLGRYRFWIVAMGWMVIGLLLVMLYRQILQHQKNKK